MVQNVRIHCLDHDTLEFVLVRDLEMKKKINLKKVYKFLNYLYTIIIC